MKAQPSAFWLLLFALAGTSAGLQGLLTGAVPTPSTLGMSGLLERDAQPTAYWLLTGAYLVAGAFLASRAWRRHREPVAFGAAEPEVARSPSPGWARGLAWLGVACGALLIAFAVFAHFALGPIVSLLFVALFGGGGLFLGLLGAGYLLTGRVA